MQPFNPHLSPLPDVPPSRHYDPQECFARTRERRGGASSAAHRARRDAVDRSVGQEYADEVEHVKHTIWALRSKIEVDPGDPKYIITERGFGYQFE